MALLKKLLPVSAVVLSLLAIGVMAQTLPSPTPLRVPLLFFENLEQYADNYDGVRVLVTNLGWMRCPSGQLLEGLPFLIRMDYAEGTGVQMVAESVEFQAGQMENLRMEGSVIRAKGGWMENVYAPVYRVVLGTLRYENLRVVLS
jgi:hypothetical protein